MSNVVQLRLDDICRACLSRDNLQPLSTANRITVLADVVNLRISLDDGLPTVVCAKCWQLCASWSAFKQRFRKNDATLRTLLGVAMPRASLKQEPEVPMDLMQQQEEEAQYATEPVYENGAEHQQLQSAEFCQEQIKAEQDPYASSPVPSVYEEEVVDEEQVYTDGCRADEEEYAQDDVYEVEYVEEEVVDDYEPAQPTTVILNNNQNYSTSPSTKKKFNCGVCGEGFNGRLAFKNHMFSHTAGRIRCPECNMRFNNHRLMDEHKRRIHSNNFDCRVCGKVYENRHSLAVHMLIHPPSEEDIVHILSDDEEEDVGEKHKCDGCDRSFKGLGQLYLHQKIHREEPYQCEYCDQNFRTTKGRETHIKRDHPEYVPFREEEF